VTLSISNPVPFPKPDGGQLMGMFVVTRSGDPSVPVLVDYATQDGGGANGAHTGIDYVATTGILLFNPYQITATIAVPIIGNNLFNADKTFSVRLSDPIPGVLFAPRETFGVSGGVGTVVVGDFNGDGKPDLATINVTAFGASGIVSVLLNITPDGAAAPSFAPQQTFPSSRYLASVALGDVNGDGKPDILVTDPGSGTVLVLLNRTPVGAESAWFAPPVSFDSGSNSGALTVGDFNGDGKPDVAVTNFLSDTVSVLLNTTPAGATVPSFASKQTFATGVRPEAVAVGDFNSDGKPDLAVANFFSNTVSVLRNATPTGATLPAFAPQQTFATGPDPSAVVVGDFNGDGKADLATVNPNYGGSFPSTVSVLLNTTPAGTTTPTFALQQTFAAGSYSDSIAIGDFNGDNKLDLAVANENTATVSVLLNVTPTGATLPAFAPQQTFTTGPLPASVAVGDFNGDHKPDLAIANANVSVLLDGSAPISVAPSFYPQQAFASGAGRNSVVVADFNGDGKTDLAVTNSLSNTVSVLLNTTPTGATAPSFAPRQTFVIPGGPLSIAVGDFNGDGIPDLAIPDYEYNTVSVLLNTTPAGATIPSFTPTQPFTTGRNPIAVAVGDFNGDGKPDLAVANYRSYSVSVLLNTTAPGATRPSFGLQRTFASGRGPHSLTVGDFNSDSRLDLAVASRQSTAVLVLLNSTPTGGNIPSFAPQVPFATGDHPAFVTVGDFNGDGKPDLAVANDTTDTVSVLLNTTPAGATTPNFVPQQTFAAGPFPNSVAVADFTGDGKPDLAVAGLYLYSGVSVLLNSTPLRATSPSFAPPQLFATGRNPVSAPVGDFNGDGKPDLVVANQRDNTVSVLINSFPITLSGSPATGIISSAPEAAAAIAVVPGTTPQSTVVNTAFAVPLAVDVRDMAGHLVQGVSITLTAPASGSSGLFGGSTSVTVTTNASGRATAPALVSNTLAGNYMVMAQASGGSNPSTTFNLTNTPTAASGFTLTDLPPSLGAGTPSMLTVTARDPFNNIATGYTGTVHLLSTDPNANLPDDYTFTAADNGIHTFAALILQTAGIRYVIASDSSDPRIVGVSSGVRVVAAAADHFAVITDAADPQVAGTPFDVTVTVQDRFNNTVIDYTGTVTFSSGDPYGATLPPDYTFQPTDQGTAAFPGGATLYAAGTWDVTVTDTGSGITGAAYVNVVAAPAVAFQGLAPGVAASGAAFDVTVVAVDPYGNTDTNYAGTVSFATSDGGPGVLLPADYTFQAADAGMAAFAGGVTLITPGDQTLTVTDTASRITGSATVTVSDTAPSVPRGSGRGAVEERPIVPRGAEWRGAVGRDAARIEGLDLVFQTLVHRRPGDEWILDW
jgi:hypothetical protein